MIKVSERQHFLSSHIFLLLASASASASALLRDLCLSIYVCICICVSVCLWWIFSMLESLKWLVKRLGFSSAWWSAEESRKGPTQCHSTPSTSKEKLLFKHFQSWGASLRLLWAERSKHTGTYLPCSSSRNQHRISRRVDTIATPARQAKSVQKIPPAS